MRAIHVMREDEAIVEASFGEAVRSYVQMLPLHPDGNHEVVRDFQVHVLGLKATTVTGLKQLGEGHDGLLNVAHYEVDVNDPIVVLKHLECDRANAVRLNL